MGGEGEFARTPTGTIPAKKEAMENSHVYLRELYLRKKEVSVKSHVVPRKLYLWKRRDDKTACISAEREMQIRNDVDKIRQ